MGVGKSTTVKVFHRWFTGAWMKDSQSDQDTVWVLKDNVHVSHMLIFTSETHMRNTKKIPRPFVRLPFRCTGTGHVVYKNALYCNRHSSNRIMKYDFATKRVYSNKIRDAGYNNSFPYKYGASTDFDFAVDERGLWLIYSSESNRGNIIIAKIDPDSLMVERSWTTNCPKKEVVNAFMICGVMYATNPKRLNEPTDFKCTFDTNTGEERLLGPGELTFDNANQDIADLNVMLDYNPKEKLLYGWTMSSSWDGQLDTYPLQFAGAIGTEGFTDPPKA